MTNQSGLTFFLSINICLSTNLPALHIFPLHIVNYIVNYNNATFSSFQVFLHRAYTDGEYTLTFCLDIINNLHNT